MYLLNSLEKEAAIRTSSQNSILQQVLRFTDLWYKMWLKPTDFYEKRVYSFLTWLTIFLAGFDWVYINLKTVQSERSYLELGDENGVFTIQNCFSEIGIWDEKVSVITS